MRDLNKGFMITCGVILAVLLASTLLCCGCGLVINVLDPTTQQVFDDLIEELEP